MKSKTSYIYKVGIILIAAVITVCMLFACTKKKEESKVPEEPVIEYKANSPLGIAESYLGSNVQDLIEELGPLKSDPMIQPANDGGGYQGTYEFEGFTVQTYAKSENSEAIVTEIIPDEKSEVYQKSIKTNDDEGSK